MAHFVGYDIGIQAFQIEYYKRLAPGRANATARAFVVVAVTLVLLRRMTQNNTGRAVGLSPQLGYALLGGYQCLDGHFLLLQRRFGCHKQTRINLPKIRKTHPLTTPHLGEKKEITAYQRQRYSQKPVNPVFCVHKQDLYLKHKVILYFVLYLCNIAHFKF
ncbi:MAG: hypothetical protein EAZ32_17070 [Cytophagia bacterium]|nr:MAG: hypothetical protein EAZ32_17070 [Cytophagia bacterium]TAG74466.1 MAG: hypothetical protein EAZ26_02025 [Runella slithyformis]